MFDILTISLGYVIAVSTIHSIYCHRSIYHQLVTYHPTVKKIFRFVLWCTTGVPGKYSVASHILHHKYADQVGDPHSPVIFGKKYMLLHRPLINFSKLLLFPFLTIKDPIQIPGDEIEQLVKDKVDAGYEYTYSKFGPIVFILFNLVVFGWPGILVTLTTVVLGTVFMYVGVDGLTHLYGYTNYKLKDNSKNVLPVAILLGGEEFGNNHHAYAADAKFSRRWFEFDIGWMVICILKFFKLASVKHSR